MDPAGLIGRESAGRNRAVHMRMKQQVLSPGMQYAQEPDLGAQVLRVGCDLKKCRRAGLKQQVIKDLRIVLAKRV